MLPGLKPCIFGGIIVQSWTNRLWLKIAVGHHFCSTDSDDHSVLSVKQTHALWPPPESPYFCAYYRHQVSWKMWNPPCIEGVLQNHFRTVEMPRRYEFILRYKVNNTSLHGPFKFLISLIVYRLMSNSKLLRVFARNCNISSFCKHLHLTTGVGG